MKKISQEKPRNVMAVMIFAKKNVETIVKIHVQLEVNVKINAKKNVERSGYNRKDPCRA